MLLLYGIWALLTLAELALQSSLDNRLQEFVCIDQACYSLFWNSRRYPRAKTDCESKNQHLMTVPGRKQADAISLLFSKVEMDNIRVWIGMEPKKGCTDINLPLRGFTWITGESYTDTIPWKNDDQKCAKSGELCVTVNNNGTWEETECTLKSDGLLCESIHLKYCRPLMLSDEYNVSYFHVSHGMGHSLSEFYPSGTIVQISPNMDNLICEVNEEGQLKWNKETPGAWSCFIEKGGCEHKCMMVNGIPECTCPLGSKLKPDKRSCSLPCDPNLCSQDCDPKIKPPNSPCTCSDGYYLAEDGKTCLDNSCAANPNTCGYHCTNSNGSFTCSCKPGFQNVLDCKIPGECGVNCKDIDECENITCAHECKNLYGSYMCLCREGFFPDKENHKNCKMFCNKAECEPDCHKGRCNCPDGYVLDETKCVDVDECLESQCEHNCINLFGTYQCTCLEGYTAHGDKCLPNGTEGPAVVTTETTITDPFPQITFSMEPAILLGICIGIITMLTVLIAMACHKLRKHYMDQHDFDYKFKNPEKYVVLQQVKTIPEWRL
ncbi:thrombomodulin-like [Pyxicephalus adspersus]|uniref:Thrombomodulin n=1 Tax=Pyxicephalus adspersus TaxID=30357 RepID=A0AAV3ACS0_PYXAD|nr:TPA: hypothetical protein GDO54_011307 [Pyxicephalus adspersus]